MNAVDRQELITELADVFADEHEAKNLLDTIGFPRRCLPSFSNADQFRRSAILELDHGVARGVRPPPRARRRPRPSARRRWPKSSART